MPKKKKVKKVKKVKKNKLSNKIKPSLKSIDKKSNIPGPDEKPEIKKTIGAAIAPINRLCVFHSINKWVIEIPQLKKISDS